MKTRTWVWALLASAGLNVFCAGFLVSRCSRARHFDEARHARRADAPLVFRVREALGDSPSDRVEQIMQRRAETVRGQRKQLRKARREARRALETEPFDPEKLRAALTQLRQASISTQKTLHEGLVELAEAVSPEQRKRLAELNWKQRRRGLR